MSTMEGKLNDDLANGGAGSCELEGTEIRVQQRFARSSGFTLIELMIVVVIIGILAAIAIPRFTSVTAQSKQAEAGTVLKQMCSLADLVFVRDGEYPEDIAGLYGWADPDAKYFSFDYEEGVASATAGAGILGAQPGIVSQSMDCATKVIS